MSFSGYYQNICEKGHEFIQQDLYIFEEIDITCPMCQSNAKFSRLVDTTNGYDEEYPKSCSARVVETGYEDIWKQDHYGNRYAVKRRLVKPEDLSLWDEFDFSENWQF